MSRGRLHKQSTASDLWEIEHVAQHSLRVMFSACLNCVAVSMLGIQGFCYHQRQPVVYFACEGQMQKFVQGQNSAEHVWDNTSDAPPPPFLQVRGPFLLRIHYVSSGVLYISHTSPCI